MKTSQQLLIDELRCEIEFLKQKYEEAMVLVVEAADTVLDGQEPTRQGRERMRDFLNTIRAKSPVSYGKRSTISAQQWDELHSGGHNPPPDRID